MGKKNTRAKIIKAAMRLLGKYTYSDLTMVKIAKEVKIGVATVYEHFQNKEDLLFKIPEHELKTVTPIFLQNLNRANGSLEKIKIFIRTILEIYEKNPDWAAVVLMRLVGNRRFVNTPASDLIRQWSRIILEIVEQGKKECVIRGDINPYVVRDIVIGYCDLNARRWLLSGRNRSLMDLTEDLTRTLVSGISTDSLDPNTI